MKKLRVLTLVHHYLVPPEDTSAYDLATVEWKTEYDVTSTLQEMGHEVRILGIEDDLTVIRKVMHDFKPHVAFNLLEAFDEITTFDSHVVSYLELLRLPYTGCNPRGLLLARDKALSKKLLTFHRVPIPDFAVIPRGRAIRRPKRLDYPLIVKSLTLDASIGISQASVVENDEKFRERVGFVHDHLGTDALIDQYIEGRALYVGVTGNTVLTVFPVWELLFTKMPEDRYRIATQRVKWSAKYQKKHGIDTSAAVDLPPETVARMQRITKRVFRTLELSGYARIDFRLDAEGRFYVLEANPNPQIAYGEEFADSAEQAGLSYEALLQRILNLGLKWRPIGRTD